MKEGTRDTLIAVAVAAGILFCTYMTGRESGKRTAMNHQEEQLTTVVEKVYAKNEGLSEWNILQMAIMKTESEYDSGAIGATQDLGVFQITPIFVAEVNRILGTEKYSHLDAFDIQKSIEMFNIVQDYHNKEHSISKAFTVQNPGGASIGYGKRVYDNIRFIKRMEEAREELLKYEVLNRIEE